MAKKERLGVDPFSSIMDEGKTAESDERITSNLEKKKKPKSINKKSEMKAESKTINNKLVLNEKKMKKGILNIKLDGELTIYTVSGIADSLKKSFQNYSELNLDLSGVNRFDTAGFQLLLIARKEAKNIEKSLKLMKPTDEVKRIFNLCGDNYNFME